MANVSEKMLQKKKESGIPSLLKEWRQSLDLNLPQMGKIYGVSRYTLACWESAKRVGAPSLVKNFEYVEDFFAWNRKRLCGLNKKKT